METVAIPPPYDDRNTMSVQELPLYPQYAYPSPQALAPSYCPCQGYASDYKRVRTKRGLAPHHYRSYRPLLHHHNPLGLLRSPFHFFLRTIPKLLAFPIMQFMRMFGGYQADPLLSRRNDLLERRRYPDFDERSRKFYKTPPRSIMISRLKKINELTNGFRRRRSIAFDTDEESFPFFKVSEVDDDGGGGDDDEIVGREFLKPLHFKQIIPHNPLFYLLNTPIRILSHLDSLKNQIRPVVSSIPLVLQNSKKYLMDFGRQFHNHLLDFASNMIGDFDHAPHFRPLQPLVPRRRYQRSLSTFAQFLQTTSSNQTEDDSFETTYTLEHEDLGCNRTKRYILKMVDEKEVEEFLKEKLGEDAPAVENRKIDKNLKVGPKSTKRLIVEPLAPKIIIDRKGKTFVEMNGLKRPFLTKRKGKQQNQEENDDISWKISNLIEQAKATTQIVGSSYDSSMYLQIVREKITETLHDIETLINTDFTKHTNLYEDLRNLQNLKSVTVNEWKQLLINNQINNMDEKIKILNSFQQLQDVRGNILKKIVQMLDGHGSFMASRLIKTLVRLQKLQCVVYSVVEDFGERLKTRTQFDPQREIRYVEYLDGINFVTGKTREELEDYLRKERDVELERRIKLLERLRELLEVEEVAKINEEARLLWEMKNIEKLQRESIKELNLKIERGQKVRKELKILFDLQKQLEVAERKQDEILEEEKREIVGKARQKAKRKNKNFKISNLPRASHLFSNVILRNKKPVRVVTDDYTVVGYLTKHK